MTLSQVNVSMSFCASHCSCIHALSLSPDGKANCLLELGKAQRRIRSDLMVTCGDYLSRAEDSAVGLSFGDRLKAKSLYLFCFH